MINEQNAVHKAKQWKKNPLPHDKVQESYPQTKNPVFVLSQSNPTPSKASIMHDEHKLPYYQQGHPNKLRTKFLILEGTQMFVKIKSQQTNHSPW